MENNFLWSFYLKLWAKVMSCRTVKCISSKSKMPPVPIQKQLWYHSSWGLSSDALPCRISSQGPSHRTIHHAMASPQSVNEPPIPCPLAACDLQPTSTVLVLAKDSTLKWVMLILSLPGSQKRVNIFLTPSYHQSLLSTPVSKACLYHHTSPFNVHFTSTPPLSVNNLSPKWQKKNSHWTRILDFCPKLL